ncbi:hypothetical protein HALLA_05740 [Halostagnicola larsenii XH-48]|uniref:Uncharacterized protein n=1 Tax=Halostagnicola larsenii XH-48 TaxID=797299 RepID=W0JTT7_9EURY|nr:hypothetical protein HALLA_05740 [Halostagnicola larsenii XH-48]
MFSSRSSPITGTTVPYESLECVVPCSFRSDIVGPSTLISSASCS